MFQIWKLVLLCGLLTGTSASLLGNLGNDLKGIIDKGREIVEDTGEVVSQNLKEDLKRLQNSQIGQLSEQILQKAGGLLSDAVSKVLSLKEHTFGLKISNVQILNLKTQLSPDGEGLDLSFPITTDVQLNLPLIGKMVDLKLSVDLLSGVRIETQNGKPKVALTKCATDPVSISLSMLDRRSELANRVVDAATSFLSQTLSTLVEAQVCPLIRLFIGTLDVDLIQNARRQLQSQSSA